MKVGFIGLGNMGLHMAANLAAAGHELTVWNRTGSKAAPLKEKGARVARTPAEAARSAEVVFTMLADDAAVTSAVFGQDGLQAGLPPGAVHVSSSTLSVALSEKLAETHASAGQRYLSAPVFGRPAAAEAKQLWVVAAGPKQDVDRCRPLLEALGRGLTVLGDTASAANVVKLSGNFLIASMMEALAESFALTRKSGIEPSVFLEVFQSVFARAHLRGVREAHRGGEVQPGGLQAAAGPQGRGARPGRGARRRGADAPGQPGEGPVPGRRRAGPWRPGLVRAGGARRGAGRAQAGRLSARAPGARLSAVHLELQGPRGAPTAARSSPPPGWGSAHGARRSGPARGEACRAARSAAGQSTGGRLRTGASTASASAARPGHCSHRCPGAGPAGRRWCG
ncbi:3-hydroxyisobutyrate dehydrogenase family protein [Corallococcus macrosporus]|uniref:3-hydroxyisobutyrate dehydrogenase family protein n=1 Tax=Myxococcus fulvus (strain ATCC BAA-855 / HW-1) TaxID=483219 RepID=F8C892_MYXFH|nr:3-hydroxyisobutyrate dehydrogenase family protein [Corallococcus macrosporus]